MVSANCVRKRQNVILQDVSQSSGFCTQIKSAGCVPVGSLLEWDAVEGPRKKRREVASEDSGGFSIRPRLEELAGARSSCPAMPEASLAAAFDDIRKKLNFPEEAVEKKPSVQDQTDNFLSDLRPRTIDNEEEADLVGAAGSSSNEGVDPSIFRQQWLGLMNNEDLNALDVRRDCTGGAAPQGAEQEDSGSDDSSDESKSEESEGGGEEQQKNQSGSKEQGKPDVKQKKEDNGDEDSNDSDNSDESDESDEEEEEDGGEKEEVEDEDEDEEQEEEVEEEEEDEEEEQEAVKTPPLQEPPKFVAKAVETTKQEASVKDEGGVYDPKKIFVGGMPYDTTEDDIHALFADCGAIADIDMATFPDTGRFKGLAFIAFKTATAAKKALSYDGTDMGGRWLKIQPCKKKAERDTTTAPKPVFAAPPPKTPGCLTVYIGNLSWDIDEATVRDFFKDCSVKAVRFVEDKVTGGFKGFGHVDFEDEQSLETAVSMDQVRCLGRPMKVSYAVVRGGAPPPQPSTWNQGGGGGGGGGGSHAEGGSEKRDVDAKNKNKGKGCFVCGEEGHKSYDCPQNQGPKKKARQN